MMKETFLNWLSRALNAYLNLDPASEKRLFRLQDEVITIELLPLHLVFQCIFKEREIQVLSGASLPADTTICGTPLGFCGVLLTKNNRQQFFADDVKMSGDAALGQHVIALFDELEIDWEEYLSRLTGDVPAYHIGRFVRHAGNWLKNAEQSFTQDVADYVHEEVKLFPPSEALRDFFNEVDTLRMDVDRCEARVQLLKSYLIENEETQ